MNYNKEFDIPSNSFDFAKDLSFGHSGENFITEFYKSVIQGCAEVKTDRYRNGRMAVETQQNPKRKTDIFGHPIWENSGINVTKATWWIYTYSLGEAFIIVSVERLKRYIRHNCDIFNEHTKVMFAKNSDNPAKGFLIEPNGVMEMLYSVKYDKLED